MNSSSTTSAIGRDTVVASSLMRFAASAFYHLTPPHLPRSACARPADPGARSRTCPECGSPSPSLPPSPPPSSSPWLPGGVPAPSKPNCFASSASSTRRSNAFFSLQPSYACFFLHEVDPSAEGCADYYRVILDEMDLDKMTAKANRGEYKTIELFKHDFDDMIENCRVYNRVGHGRFLHRRRWRACWPTLRPSRRSSRRSTNC